MSLSDDDFLERLRSTTMADDQDDDADAKQLERLRQLRGVWLAMPDEDPPKAGIAELMAAASAKAAELQPRTRWWQVLLATLRRPPVLALATVVVLVGGVVFVGRHHDAVESAEPIAPPTTATRSRAPSGSATLEDRKEASGPATQPEAPAVVASPAPAVSPRDVAPGPVDTLKSAPVVVVPKPPAISTTHHAVSKKPEPVMDFESKKSRPSETPPPPPPELSTRTGAALAGADEQVVRSSAPRPDTADASARVEGHAGKTAATPAVSADQLYQQCKQAAASGDCARVKLLAAQVAKADAGVYRDKLLKDAAVANCLK